MKSTILFKATQKKREAHYHPGHFPEVKIIRNLASGDLSNFDTSLWTSEHTPNDYIGYYTGITVYTNWSKFTGILREVQVYGNVLLPKPVFSGSFLQRLLGIKAPLPI